MPGMTGVQQGILLDKAIGVQRFFRLNSVIIGFVALRSAYASILRSGNPPPKNAVCRKSPTGYEKIFSFWKSKNTEYCRIASDETNKTGNYSVSGTVVPRLLCLAVRRT